MVGSARLVRGRSLRMLVTGRSLLRGRPADPVGSIPPPSRMLVTPPITLVKGSSVPVGRATPLITVVTPPMMLVRGSSVPVGRATPLMTVVTPPMMLVKGDQCQWEERRCSEASLGICHLLTRPICETRSSSN